MTLYKFGASSQTLSYFLKIPIPCNALLEHSTIRRAGLHHYRHCSGSSDGRLVRRAVGGTLHSLVRVLLLLLLGVVLRVVLRVVLVGVVGVFASQVLLRGRRSKWVCASRKILAVIHLIRGLQ